jgi:hypothetical protein
LFRNVEDGDFRLQANSPCIDSGTKVALSEDLIGNPRPIDIPGKGVDGPDAFDMGAYEFQLRPADLNGDGLVGPEDLLLFQTEWMENKGGSALRN